MVKMINMIHKMYGVFAVTLLFALSMTFTVPVDVLATEAAPAAVMIDEASLLMEEERDWLKSEALALSEKSGWNVILSTCDDANGESAQYVCEDTFNTCTTGDDGVSCLIDMDNREIYIATAGEAQLYLTDDRIDDILDEAYEAVADGDYSECLYIMVYRISEYYDSGIPQDVEIYDEDTKEVFAYDETTGELVKKSRFSLSDALIALGAAVLAFGIMFGVIVGKYKLKWGTYSYDFRENGDLNLRNREDRFVNQVVTRRHIPKNDGNSGGSGSRSSVHSGAGGRSFGGGGRKF